MRLPPPLESRADHDRDQSNDAGNKSRKHSAGRESHADDESENAFGAVDRQHGGQTPIRAEAR